MKLKQAKSSAGLAGILLASLVSMASLDATAADKAVASLGAVSVPDGELQKMLEAMPAAERAAVKGNRPGVENWLRQRVVSEVVLREARSKGWADRPEIKARVEAAVKEVTARIVTTAYLESVTQVPADYPSDAEVAAAYEQAKAGFGLPATYRLAQIYLPVTPGDAAEGKKVAERARKLATQARAGDFAALAKAESQDKASAERGGEVGTLALAEMLPEVRDTVAKMKVGQVSEPVQAAAGIHIVKLLDAQPARTATLEEMKPRLQQALRQQRQQQLLQEHIAKLAPADRINIDTAALDAALQKTN
ncbi:peptidylprolyl isomerase [Herbaspirillum frisingense]|uniref:peptidylprolyl isomerase n=1 Tax=Herbaspirillum frisingense TaxID=92645 RepID=UPI001F1EC690|nr:peptidylprolyl isomerase [Herbaspirillum frisingense]UIN21422.1 peptidyl-prolyl cis-trans isomerase [Herbaspirillum frisingense]